MVVKEKIVVVGGAGNVGQGIIKAFLKHGWDYKIIDPKKNKTFEKLTASEVKKTLSSVNHVVYAAEIGNRDLYERSPKLEKENNLRFNNFCKKVSQINPQITIWYVGGSWTKRKPNNKWLVTDNSPNKNLAECNPYEKAKISAEKNAKSLSKIIKIRFLDWASIVPNLSDNFSIPKMVKQALNEEKITYSPGPYGRPLLESTQAGQALILLIKNNREIEAFERFLIPGVFITFEKFAYSVKRVVVKETGKKIKLEKQASTPDFLKIKTQSTHHEKIGFNPNKKIIFGALEQNAFGFLKKLENI